MKSNVQPIKPMHPIEVSAHLMEAAVTLVRSVERLSITLDKLTDIHIKEAENDTRKNDL